ncbi:MAG: hypothetical protein NTX61_05475 [Bacteroidetes bacterium]|nr:hypothetical protein [Bacteroidota bacterium]
MFIGHYGVAYIVKTKASDIPLWLLFTSVQLLDIIAFTLVLLGIEKASFVPSDNPFFRNYLDLPYSHSLSGTLLISAIVLVIFWAMDKKTWAWILGSCVLSHWVIDLIVHTPDLSLFFGSSKVGLGLWHYPILTYILEIAFVVIGWMLLKKNLYSYLLLFLMVGAFTGMVFAEEPPIFREHYVLRTSIVLIANLLFIFVAYLWDRETKSQRTESGYRDSRYIYKTE